MHSQHYASRATNLRESFFFSPIFLCSENFGQLIAGSCDLSVEVRAACGDVGEAPVSAKSKLI